MSWLNFIARYGLPAWLFGLALVGILSLVSIRLPGFHLDKLGHFMAFFALTYLAFRIWPAGRAWLAAGLLLLFGAGIEVAQLFIASRSASLFDLACNAAGITAAIILAKRKAERLDRPTSRPGSAVSRSCQG